MPIKKSKGFILVELMLAMIILVGWMTYAMQQKSQVSRDTDAINVAKSMEHVKTASYNYILANGAGIKAATNDGTNAGDYCVGNNASDGTGGETLNNTTLHTCAFDVNWLKFKGFMDASAQPINTLDQQWVVIVRQIFDGATATGNLEMLVVPASTVGSTSVTPDGRPWRGGSLEQAASFIGTEAGVVPNDSTHPCGWGVGNANRYICGTQGAWRVRLSDFVN